MKVKTKKLLLEDSGQGLVEYSMILFFIALALTAAVGTVGTKILEFFGTAAGMFPSD